jgi:hypothetical protein
MDAQQKLTMVSTLTTPIDEALKATAARITLLAHGPGARELAHAKTKLQEAKHWAEEAARELEATIPVAIRVTGGPHD